MIDEFLDQMSVVGLLMLLGLGALFLVLYLFDVVGPSPSPPKRRTGDTGSGGDFGSGDGEFGGDGGDGGD
ncbi:hypothetical protein [Streptomyces smyrnaeus]|uniref:hypothetical protein n=1 Tax=Streptomyces smyrnaeus TaxID=1387713 RepID=UPI003676FF53